MSDKTRWVQVGRLWKGRDGSSVVMSGTISLGLLGEIQIKVFAGDKPGEYSISTPTTQLLINRIMASLPDPTSARGGSNGSYDPEVGF